MKIIINPAYQQLADFVSRIPEIFDREGSVIYEGRNVIKVFQAGNIVLNVKRFKKPFYLNRLVYTFFRSPKAARAYEHALTLLSKEVETPAPIAYIIYREAGLLSWSYFVSIQIPDVYQTLYEVGQGPIEENEDIFRALGIYTAHLHQKGIYHKDYSPGNILYYRSSEEIKFCLIDINRMSFGTVSLRKGCANFARLWGKEKAFRILAESYADTMRINKTCCVNLVLRYRRSFWRRYAKKYPIKFEM